MKEQAYIKGNLLTHYSIVISQNAPIDVKSDALKLQKTIAGLYDLKLPVISDRLSQAGKELRLGKTRRWFNDNTPAESYSVKIDEEGNVSVLAGHYLGVHAAVQAIIDLLTKNKDGGEVLAGADAICGTVSTPLTWEDDGSVAELLGQEFIQRDYKLVWNDEFDDPGINRDKWVGNANMHMNNSALSFDEDVVEAKGDGKLVMTTTCTDPVERKYLTNYSVSTHDTMNFKGGYLEMRAKVPFKGMGEWPSFWAVSSAAVLYKQAYKAAHNGSLNFCGYGVEVDFFEIFSSTDTVVPNLHKWFSWDVRQNFEKLDGGAVPNRVQLSGVDAGASKSGTRVFKFQDKDGKSAKEIANEWHNYGFLWTEDYMAFSLDGEFYFAYSLRKEDESDAFNPTFRNKETGEEIKFGMKGYGQALAIILNNMFFSEAYGASDGGRWAASKAIDAKNDAEMFPLIYEVDYIRLYQAEGDKLYTPENAGKNDKLFDRSKYAELMTP